MQGAVAPSPTGLPRSRRSSSVSGIAPSGVFCRFALFETSLQFSLLACLCVCGRSDYDGKCSTCSAIVADCRMSVSTLAPSGLLCLVATWTVSRLVFGNKRARYSICRWVFERCFLFRSPSFISFDNSSLVREMRRAAILRSAKPLAVTSFYRPLFIVSVPRADW